MNLEQLQGFLMVAETGHFTQAAAQLHVAQPTLSRQIATLETELGSELFNRARGNITLTAAGETLLPVASRIIADADHIRFQMQELAGLRRGRVRLGAPPSMCVSVVAEVVGPYNQDYPGVDLHLRESGSRHLLNELIGGTLDLALVVASEHDPTSAESLDHTPLLIEELVIISADRHFSDASDQGHVHDVEPEGAETPVGEQQGLHGEHDRDAQGAGPRPDEHGRQHPAEQVAARAVGHREVEHLRREHEGGRDRREGDEAIVELVAALPDRDRHRAEGHHPRRRRGRSVEEPVGDVHGSAPYCNRVAPGIVVQEQFVATRMGG